MRAEIKPQTLSGTINCIPSKSDLHRLLICASFSDSPTVISLSCGEESEDKENMQKGRQLISKDIDATVSCLSSLGAGIAIDEDKISVEPISRDATSMSGAESGAVASAIASGDAKPSGTASGDAKSGITSATRTLNCGESGSTLRFLLPVATALHTGNLFSGEGRLPERPLFELIEEIKKHGVSFSSDKLPFSTSGRMSGGEFHLPGNVSSQYISGLLMAFPLLVEDSTLYIDTKTESESYISMTLSVLKRFGISVVTNNFGESEQVKSVKMNNFEEREQVKSSGNMIPTDMQKSDTLRDELTHFFISADQKYISPGRVYVEGDWSNAAFFLAAGALGSFVEVRGLNPSSSQGDMKIIDILNMFGAHSTIDSSDSDTSFTASASARKGTLKGIETDISQIPDLLPILAVVAAFANGESRFKNASRLRLKESDRLTSTATMINDLGGAALELPDELVIHGTGKPLRGGNVDSFGDHRIAMAAAIAAAHCLDTVIINNAQVSEKSYPSFFNDFNKLGGKANVI